jgi:hypothetical protein
MTEENFNKLLPEYLQKASRLYFTPIHIARSAAQWLTQTGSQRVLDIGAGVGKFCVAGAKCTDSHFYGIEYRPSLVELANKIIDHFKIENASILNQNVVEVDFSFYDAFYLYNPFYENFLSSRRLNNEVELACPLFGYYFKYTRRQLHSTKAGTRLVTYHGNNYEVPDSFKKVKESENGLLKFWVKAES